VLFFDLFVPRFEVEGEVLELGGEFAVFGDEGGVEVFDEFVDKEFHFDISNYESEHISSRNLPDFMFYSNFETFFHML
jgi:hypothetical protein